MGPDGEFTSSNNWPFISMKICLKALKITEVGSKFGQTLNKGLKDYQTFNISPKSGHTESTGPGFEGKWLINYNLVWALSNN